jgi:predicted DNA-binding transcriptional regulator AlpA
MAPGGDGSRPLTPSSFYTPESLAAYLQVPLSTIESWSAIGYGPVPVHFGELIRYPAETVEAWVAQQLFVSQG